MPFTRPAVDRQIARIRGGTLQNFLRHPSQHDHGIVAGRFPDHGVQSAEHRTDGVVPAPHNVQPQLRQTPQRRRQRRPNQEFFDGVNAE